MQLSLENENAILKERGERLRRVRNLANLSRKDICARCDININTYIRWEVGQYGGLTQKGAEKIIYFLSKEGVYSTVDWLMKGIGPAPHISINQLAEENTTQIEDSFSKEIKFFLNVNSGSIIFEIKDDTMFPQFNIGDFVGGICKYENNILETIDLDCIVKLTTGEMLARNVRRGKISEKYTLVSLNINSKFNDSPVLYDQSLIYSAPIIWHRKINLKKIMEKQ